MSILSLILSGLALWLLSNIIVAGIYLRRALHRMPRRKTVIEYRGRRVVV